MRFDVLCNGTINPKGVDFNDLRFTFVTEDVESIKSIEYEFYLSNELQSGNYFYKKKTTKRHTYVSFNDFACGARIYYRAKIATQNAEYYSNVYFAENGLVDVVGKWIDSKNFDGRVMQFSKKFTVSNEVTSARLYIVGLGAYTSKINGKSTDDYYFKPLLTDFDFRYDLKNNAWYDKENFNNDKKTICYDTFDVTHLINKGENEISVLLGTGWYHNVEKDFVDPSYTYSTPKLFFELHISGDGFSHVIASDESCVVQNTNIVSLLYAGDRVDFTKPYEPFTAVTLAKAPSGKLVPSYAIHDAVIETLAPLSAKKGKNKITYDFGKNHTGALRLRVKGNRGDKLKIKYFEVLAKNGEPNYETSRWVAYKDGKEPISHIDQQGEFVLSGDVDEIAPLFHWNCYRYAEVFLPEGCKILSVESLFISADIALDANFFCSIKVLNDIFRAFVITQRDNMHCGVPSDCPHREKLPYTGDGQLAIESTMYLFDAETFYRKWLKDIISAQGNDGWVPYTAPYIGGGGGYWWCNALTTVPLILYKLTGDKQILQQAFLPSQKLVMYYDKMHDGDYVITKGCSKWLLGDWLAPTKIESDIAYVNSVAFYSAVSQVEQMAQELNETAIAEQMQDLIAKIKDAINIRFFNKDTLSYGNGVQGENVFALHYGFVPSEYYEALKNKVIDHYKKTGQLDTGIVLTPLMIETLTNLGATDVVFRIMLNEKFPSYHYMLEGETTLCEHWSKYWPPTSSAENEETVLTGDVSHCHPMLGSVVAWMFKHVAGLDLSEAHKQKITFAPKFIPKVASAKAQKETFCGLASIEYEAYGSIKMKISVPYGMQGEVRLPISVCETLYANSDSGIQLKSRKNGDYTCIKLLGGKWAINSQVTFGNW